MFRHMERQQQGSAWNHHKSGKGGAEEFSAQREMGQHIQRVTKHKTGEADANG